MSSIDTNSDEDNLSGAFAELNVLCQPLGMFILFLSLFMKCNLQARRFLEVNVLPQLVVPGLIEEARGLNVNARPITSSIISSLTKVVL